MQDLKKCFDLDERGEVICVAGDGTPNGFSGEVEWPDVSTVLAAAAEKYPGCCAILIRGPRDGAKWQIYTIGSSKEQVDFCWSLWRTLGDALAQIQSPAVPLPSGPLDIRLVDPQVLATLHRNGEVDI